MATKLVNDTSLTSVANAIRLKAEISGSLEFPDDFVSAIQSISKGITPSGTKSITENGTYDVTNYASANVNVSGGGGGSSATPNDVNFFDYDGTLVDSYSASEFAALTALPANPTHAGLTAHGWNWSLANAKAYVAKYGKLNIGQMYVTTSGDTEIDIQLGIGRNKPYLGCCPNGTVDIDWGDGSAHDTLTGTSTSTLKYIQHTYPDTGEAFTIKLHMESGLFVFSGTSTSTTGSRVIFNGANGQTNGQRSYQNAVKAVRFGNHVSNIGNYAFNNCYSLTSVTLPENLTEIGHHAFKDCYSLTSVTLPEGLTSIGEYAFSNCYSLTSVMLPEGLTSIDDFAFNGCFSLISVTLPEGLTSIDASSFSTCYSLTSVILPEGLTSIGSTAFSNCYSLTSVTLPEGLMSIDGYAFSTCYSLTSVTLPESLTSIGVYAFSNCNSLTSITLPESLTSIGDSVFNNCYSLTSVTLPEGLTSIGGQAFGYCRSLTCLEFKSTTPPTVGSSAFVQVPTDLVVYVPAGTLETYRAATNYSTIANKMVERTA